MALAGRNGARGEVGGGGEEVRGRRDQIGGRGEALCWACLCLDLVRRWSGAGRACGDLDGEGVSVSLAYSHHTRML